MKSIQSEYSDFWLGDNFNVANFNEDNVIDLIKLSSLRRAISNFVFILTGKSIPVRFAESGQSFTDGETVFIGSSLSHGDIDVTVGVSLHEATHIVKSDFDLIKTFWGKIPQRIYDAADKKLSRSMIIDFSKYVLNIVEDRYIDAWSYKNAPGYRGYYSALYRHYFHKSIISKALKEAYLEPTLESYKFRLTYIMNPSSDPDALPGFKEVVEKLDLDNILRLENPLNRLDMASDITEIIINNIVKADQDKCDGKSDNKNEDGESDENDSDEGSVNNNSCENDGDGGQDEVSDTLKDKEDSLGEKDGSVPKVDELEKQKELSGKETNPSNTLTENELDVINKVFKKQVDVVEGKSEPAKFSDETISKLKIMEESGVEIIQVGGDTIPTVDCVVVKNMTKELMSSNNFPLSSGLKTFINSKPSLESVTKGVVFGSMLGRKLQIRGESKTSRTTRLEDGKFDRRLIAELGFGCDRIFYQTQTEQFKKAHMHISVDASSSMKGNKWRKTMTAVVAMAKAASMVNNLSVSISFRTGIVEGSMETVVGVTCKKCLPYVVIAYDSRKDKFSKITQLFPLLIPEGPTPEGLAFQAILKLLPNTSSDLDSYFVNISDGEPDFSGSYCGHLAHIHTQKQVNKIRNSGIEVLSYFIEGESDSFDICGYRSESESAFKTMYGKDAQIIDIENVMEIARTMNKRFLTNQ